MIAEGTQNGEKIRMIAGNVDGRGVLYEELYKGAALLYALPYTRVFVDDQETNVRELYDVVLDPAMTADGFTFTARLGLTPVSCTALVWSDASVNCSRNTGWVPPGSAGCAAAFKGHDTRFQCNGLQQAFANPVIAHDDLLSACTSSFRFELFRESCIRYGYNFPAIFYDTLQACTTAYRTEDGRNYCLFYALAPAEPADRIPASTIRECDRLYDDEKQTSLCGFRVNLGGRADEPEPVVEPRITESSLQYLPTAPLALTVTPASHVIATKLHVATGTHAELTLRATGGMVDTEPVLFVDAFGPGGDLKWSQIIDRIKLGKDVRALRELTKLDRVKLSKDTLTFRAVHEGKTITCRGDAARSIAICR